VLVKLIGRPWRQASPSLELNPLPMQMHSAKTSISDSRKVPFAMQMALELSLFQSGQPRSGATLDLDQTQSPTELWSWCANCYHPLEALPERRNPASRRRPSPSAHSFLAVADTTEANDDINAVATYETRTEWSRSKVLEVVDQIHPRNGRPTAASIYSGPAARRRVMEELDGDVLIVLRSYLYLVNLFTPQISTSPSPTPLS
jgi:hypothetical protein